MAIYILLIRIAVVFVLPTTFESNDNNNNDDDEIKYTEIYSLIIY